MNDDDFLARLRATAHDAVPPSGLDLAVVLRSSRRKARARRATTAVASVAALAVLGAGVSSAVTNPQVAALFEPAGYETQVAEPTTAEIAPGVVAVVEPATYVLDDGTTVLDTGLDAWGEDERVLAVVGFHTDVGNAYHPASTRFVLGGDDELEALLRGDDAGRSFEIPPSAQRGVVVTRPDREDALYLGSAGTANGSGTTEAYLVPWESADADPADPEIIRLTGVTGERPEPWGIVATELRGLSIDRIQGKYVHSSSSSMFGMCHSGWCAVEYDPATGQVVDPRETPSGVADLSSDPRTLLENAGERWADPVGVAATLRAYVGDSTDRVELETELLTLCLAERGVDAPELRDRYLSDDGVSDHERRVRIRCELDVLSETSWRRVQEELAQES